MLQGEGAALEVATGAAKAGRAARLGALLLELGLPGPLDVFFLFLSAFASIAEAKAKLKAEYYALGFAQGLSASLTGTSASKTTRLLMFRVADPDISERVAGIEGCASAPRTRGSRPASSSVRPSTLNSAGGSRPSALRRLRHVIARSPVTSVATT
jgi:hypothetical protein